MITREAVMQQLEQIQGLKPHEAGPGIGLLFQTDSYVNPGTGQNVLLILLQLEENGEYLKIFVPAAWKVKGRNVDDFLRACMMIQWRTKLIHFEYGESDGEIRPMIEWPIEDGTVTAKQLKRAIFGMKHLVDDFAPAFDKALATGVVDLPPLQ